MLPSIILRGLKLLFFLLFNLYSVSYAQNQRLKEFVRLENAIERLGDLMMKQYENEKFDSAIVYAKQKDSLTFLRYDSSREYAESSNDVGVIYHKNFDYDNAEKYFNKAIIILEKYIGEDDDDYATFTNNLSVLLADKGLFASADSLYKKSIFIRKTLFEQTGDRYAESLNNLGNFYRKTENYDSSKTYLEQSLLIRKRSRDSLYAQTLNTLGLVIQKTGDYITAEKKYKEALYVIDSCCEGKKLNEYWDISNNLASLYFDMANYKAAETIHRHVLSHIIDKFHKKIVDYASTLTLLANDYNASGQYDSALYFLKEASGILLKELGNNHPDYATNLASIGSTYEKLGILDSAESNYIRVLEIRRKKLGVNNPAYAETLTNLGRIALKKKNFNGAENNFKQAEKIRFNKWGEYHPDYAESMNDLAGLYYASNNYQEWSRSIGAAISTWKNSTMHLLLSFGEKEKQTYLDNHLSQRDILLSMLWYFSKHNNTDSLHGYYFKLVTALQGWLLSGSQELNKLVSQKKDTSLISLYNRWLSVKNKYAYAIQLSKKEQEKFHPNSDSLQQLAGDMEKSIIEKLPELLQSLNNTAANPSYVSGKLKDNEVLINWVSFRYKNPQRWTDSVLYAAFLILPNDSVPKFVSAFGQNELKALLVNYFNYSGRGVDVKPTITKESIGIDLYKLVWNPLVPYLKNASKVFIIPSGLLNKVSFQSIEDSMHRTLLETVEVHLLNNTDELNKISSTTQDTKTISLFGGANFDSTLSGESIDLNTNKIFDYLKGTNAEVKQVSDMFRNNKWSTTLYFGTAASEKNFKDLSGNNSPEILHIATHGFYLDSNTTAYRDKSAFPLLRSGFALSGANVYWTKENTSANNEDGIITAQEISNLNFSNTKLVTLSACETALGDINNNEGVYGLQRAFKIAGVKEMLITLWSIDDNVTKELMNFFYQHVLSGDSYYEALRKAQLTVKEKHPNPALWAGFELIGE